MSAVTVSALMDNLRAKLPGASDDVIKLEMYNTVDQLCREGLRITAPTNVDADPTTWLATQYWVPNYQCILNGTLARMYVQPGKPYFSADLAKLHYEGFALGIEQARGETSSFASIYDRIISFIHMVLPLVRPAQIDAAMHVTIDKIRREALRQAPLAAGANTPSAWLTTGEWDDCYQAILNGTMFRLLVEVGKPWANPELAAAYLNTYQTELDLLRGENAVTAASVYERMVNTIRVTAPGSRDEVIKLEAFVVANKVRIESLRLSPLTASNSDPATWFTATEWDAAFQTVLHGTLFRLLMQNGKPYFNPELAKAELAIFETEMDLLRGEDAATPAAIYERVIDNCRVRCVGARDAAIKLEMFNAAQKIRAEALELPPLTDSSVVPSDWLPVIWWDDSYLALLHGTLYNLHLQVGKPYFNPELAKAHFAEFSAELDLLRVRESATPATIYHRLLDSLRIAVILARTNAIENELFNTADAIRREALQLPPMTDADVPDPTKWIPADKLSQCYPALFHGAAMRLHLQFGKPYYNPDTAKAHAVVYERELSTLRSEIASGPNEELERLMDNLRTRLPGARDVTIQLELFNVVRDYLDQTNIWSEDLEIQTRAGDLTYDLVPTGVASISRILSITDDENRIVQGSMDEDDVLTLVRDPDGKVLTVKVALTTVDPTDRDGYPQAPDWLWSGHYEAILEGVLGRMMSHVAKPYSSERMAIFHMRNYSGAISAARVDWVRGKRFRTQAWRFPQTFTMRRH